MYSKSYRNCCFGKVSDIHLEIFEEYSQIRFRVDGKLTRIAMISSESHTTMISQIKYYQN